MLSSQRYRAGTVHYLDYDEFAPQEPEMVKGRGVVIISPAKRRNADLVIVVPLSTRPVTTYKKHAVRIIHDELNGQNGGSWAKCDMPITVSTSRLRDYRRPKYEGQNEIPAIRISGEELRRVREALIRAIGAKELLDRLRLEQNARLAKAPAGANSQNGSGRPVFKPTKPRAARPAEALMTPRKNRPLRPA